MLGPVRVQGFSVLGPRFQYTGPKVSMPWVQLVSMVLVIGPNVSVY